MPRDRGVVLWKGALALQGGHHRNLQVLGQFHQLAGGLGVEDALAGGDDGPLGGKQGAGGPGHRLRVSGGADDLRRRVVELLLPYFLGNQVAGDFQQDGTGLAGAQLGEGVAHQLRHPVGVVDLGGPLGDALVAAGGTEYRVYALPVAGSPGRQQQDGHRVGVGLGHPAKGVLGAGAGLHQENAGALPVGNPGKAVGHVDAGAFLAKDNGSDAGYGGGLDEGIGGHAPDKVHAFQLEHVGNCGNAVHGFLPPVVNVIQDHLFLIIHE